MRIYFVDFRRSNVCFVSRPMKIVTFLRKNDEKPKLGCFVSSGKRHIPKQNHGNRRGF